MTKRNFILLLMLLFFMSFLWAGGDTIFSRYVPTVSYNQKSVSSMANLWDRAYRIVALKRAVTAKIDKTHYIALQDIPLSLQQAIIAVEDNRFYRHVGFDIEGILRATLVNMQSGAIAEGGSTITQQLVKNLFLSQDQTVGRKLEEIVLSIDMELRYSKEEILELYLNTIYFGSGAYGIGDAAQVYFGKPPAKLNLAECAMLAGLPNAPSLTSPYVDFAAAKQRQAVVLASMVKYGYIGPSLAQEARLSPIILAR